MYYKIAREGERLKPNKYSVSTSTQWFAEEIKIYAQIYEEKQNHKEVRKYLLENNVFNNSSQQSAKDRIGKVARRAESLGEEGMSLLSHSSIDDEKALILMSYLNSYRVIYEFVFEWLAPRMNEFQPIVFTSEFENFYYHKQLQHPEELKLTEGGLKRIQSQVFNMLTHSSLLVKKDNGTYELHRLLLSETLSRFFIKSSPYDSIII
ncbi:hypothetical protein CN491_24960 [Bacillus cereus]|uniref:DUF1819 family protein n=1 Tax=Bacillus cereus TaxID=1396 RepID=A0A2A8LHB7_BACCE|nr:hypothetical protein CN491_24960 [Bacillus cereus]PFP78543.1 hypothetical protein COJ95_11795 [Bacillus cereus]